MILKQVITKVRRVLNPTIVLAAVLAISIFKNSVLSNENRRLNLDNEINTNNIGAYVGILNDANYANNVLRLDINTLSASKDNLLQQLDSARKELKISENHLKTAMIQQSSVIVSGKDTVLVNDSCEFIKEFRPNDLTLLRIELKEDSLQYKLNIQNDQYLYIYTDKDWKNKNKKFFKRLFTWDWKKITYYKYEILNTNSLIEIGKTRVIENTESK